MSFPIAAPSSSGPSSPTSTAATRPRGGRWGNGQLLKGVRPRTVHKYYGDLRTFFRFLVAEEVLEGSPMDAIRPPVCRADQVQPFNQEQVDALVAAARRSRHAKRDEAIVLFLLDTGCRASDLCSLRYRGYRPTGPAVSVLGKGNKHRPVYLGRETTKGVWQYLKSESEQRQPADPLFMSERGTRAGEALTRSGLLQLIERLGRAAKVEACRCSPHTFRHTFAVEFLRDLRQAPN